MVMPSLPSRRVELALQCLRQEPIQCDRIGDMVYAGGGADRAHAGADEFRHGLRGTQCMGDDDVDDVTPAAVRLRSASKQRSRPTRR